MLKLLKPSYRQEEPQNKVMHFRYPGSRGPDLSFLLKLSKLALLSELSKLTLTT